MHKFAATATMDPDSTSNAGLVPQPCSRSNKQSRLLTEQDINKILERKLGANGFRVLDWSLNPLQEKNGFLGQYYSLSVAIKIDDKLRALKFFAKTPPPSGNPQYEFLMRYDTFNKEIVVYTEIFERIGKGTSIKWQPEFYLGKSNTIIVLEDAKHEGYATPNKYIPLDMEHCVCAIKALSMLHSRSMILDEKMRRDGRTILDLYGHLLKEVLFLENDARSQKILSSCLTGANALVDLADGLEENQRTALKNRIREWFWSMPRLLDTSTKYRNVLCHRDVWVNNLMFKYDHAGKPTGCYLVDYQFLRYCPPAYDILFFLYMTTDRATRDRHLDALLKIYYESMRQELAREELDIEDCLPWVEFLKSCELAKLVGLVYTTVCLQVVLLTASAMETCLGGSVEQIEQTLYGDKRSELVVHQCRVEPLYKSRCVEIILELRDRLPDHPPSF